MSENQKQESQTKKADNSTQDGQRLRVWQRLPAQTEQEPQSAAGMFNRTPSNLLTQRSMAWPRSAVVQTKLTVNEPDDSYEQEADQMAEAVMRMPNEPRASEADYSPSQASPSPSVDATAEAEPEREGDREEMDWMADSVMRLPYHTSGIPVAESGLSSIQAKLIHRACTTCEEETVAARQAATDEPPTVTAPVENRIENMNGSGNPLPDSERSFFESRMGADFSGVRIHNDSNAAQTSRDLSARAFTVGNNIAFNSGEYQPGTTGGRELLAHELTHTMQQGAAPQLKRKPEAEEGSQEESIEEEKATEAVEESQELTMAPERDEAKLARSPEESMGSTGGAAPKEVISLEADTFNPSAAFETYFEENEGASTEVEATLGNLAKGSIEVEKSGDGYQTKDGNAQAIKFSHPVLAPLAEANVTPVLGVKIQGNAISGFLTIGTPGEAAPDISKLVNWIKDNPEAMGWLGFDLKDFPSTSNELEGGELKFNVEGFKFKLGGFLEGSGSFGLENTTASFEANADIRIEGLTESSLEISGDSGGNLKGSANVPVSLDKFSGELNATYDNGIVEIKGKAGYDTEKLSGEVELIVTDEATASSVAQQQLEADSIIESAETTAGSGGGEAKDGPRAMAGWGTLDFRFTEWLTGQAQVIIDNKGQITVIGEIAPPAEVEIFPQKDYIKELFEIEVRAQYGVPLLANVFLFGNVGMEAVAKIGPAKLYNIKLEGTYSTDPNVLNDFSLQGTLNMSAFAGLRLTVEGGAGAEVLDHDVKAGIGINAMGGVKGYVEATPTIGYREQAAPSEGKQGDFYIKGHMELAGQPFIGLGGELFVELDSPWWSPAGDHKWPWELGNLEYPLPGEFGIGADIDYTIGSGEMPEIQFGEVDFNAEKFMTDLVNDKVPPKSDKAEQQGEWQEDSTSGAGNVEPTVTDSEGPPPEDATLGGKQEEGIGKVPPPEIEKQWQAGLSTLGNLAKTSQEEPLTKDEIQKSLKSSGFDVRIEPTGEDFTVYVSMGELSNEKKPTVIKGKGGEDELKKAKDAFGMELFSRQQLQDICEVNQSAALKLLNEWMNSEKAWRVGQGPSTKYTFDKEKADHPSKFVENVNGKYMIKAELLQVKAFIRGTFYGKSYRTAVYDMKEKALNTPVEEGGMKHPTDESKYIYENKEFDKSGKTKPSIEHTEPVVEHWENKGRKSTQPPRKDFFNDTSDLIIMPLNLNSAEGASKGGKYNPEVGEEFRGPGE